MKLGRDRVRAMYRRYSVWAEEQRGYYGRGLVFISVKENVWLLLGSSCKNVCTMTYIISVFCHSDSSAKMLHQKNKK